VEYGYNVAICNNNLRKVHQLGSLCKVYYYNMHQTNYFQLNFLHVFNLKAQKRAKNSKSVDFCLGFPETVTLKVKRFFFNKTIK
jgi:hypothetical protein